METVCISEPVDSSNCTKEELTEIIRKLQTENTRLQSALAHKEEQKIRLTNVGYAIDHASENIFALNADGYFVFANKQFMKEHKQEDLTDCYALNILFTLNNKQQWEDLKVRIHANQGVLEYIAEMEKADGQRISYETVIHTVKDSDDNIAYWFFARDIRFRREQEIKIRELNAVMDAILNNIPVYLFVKDIDDDFRYIYWNKAFEVHSGIPASKVIGYTDFDIFPNREDAQKFRNDDLELLRSNRRIEYIEDYTNVSGTKQIVKTFK